MLNHLKSNIHLGGNYRILEGRDIRVYYDIIPQLNAGTDATAACRQVAGATNTTSMKLLLYQFMIRLSDTKFQSLNLVYIINIISVMPRTWYL